MGFAVVALETFSNEDFGAGFTINDDDGPVDLTGSEFIAHIRSSKDSLSVILEASTDNGLLVIGDQESTGEFGLVEWNIPVDVIQEIEPGTYVYDVTWIMPGGARDTTHGGTFTVNRGITRT